MSVDKDNGSAEPVAIRQRRWLGDETWRDVRPQDDDENEEIKGYTYRTLYTAPPAPVSAEPVKLEVWCGSMPESNGKSNFTATLRRKGAALFDSNCFTFARSEYPDRVRYEADSMRFLIGEIDKEPFILDYDGDKYSGYVAPPKDSDLKDAEIERGWHETFSTSNPYCPCNLKSFTKAVRWTLRAIAAKEARKHG